MVVSSRRQANVDKAVALLQSQSIQVTGTTCNVGKGEDREQLVQMVRSRPSCSGVLRGVRAAHKLYKTKLWLFIITQLLNGCSFLHIFLLLDSIRVASWFKIIIICLASQLILCKKKKKPYETLSGMSHLRGGEKFSQRAPNNFYQSLTIKRNPSWILVE